MGCVATALGLGIAAPCQGQQPHHEVAGVVTDTAGKPISNATVIVVGASITAITDAMGRYRLCDVPTPTVALRAAFINFRAVVKDSVVLRDSVTVVDFRLVSSPITLNTIDITRAPPGSYLTNGGGRPPVHLDSAAVKAPVPPPSCHR